MSTTEHTEDTEHTDIDTDAGAAEEHPDVHVEHEHAHPSDFQYVMIAVFLAIVTGAEVGLYYVELDFLVLATVLCVLMVVKFVTVVAFFMHLRFDSKLFRWVFATGLILALLVYLIVLSTFHVVQNPL